METMTARTLSYTSGRHILESARNGEPTLWVELTALEEDAQGVEQGSYLLCDHNAAVPLDPDEDLEPIRAAWRALRDDASHEAALKARREMDSDAAGWASRRR